MRLHNVLDKIVGHEVKAGILRILCEKNTGWTGRQLAKELGISPTTSGKFLQALASEGIVVIKGVGKSYLYNLNERSYIVKNILLPFFEKEKNIINYISMLVKKAVLKSGADIVAIAIFGSVASKTETPESDLDIAIIIGKTGDKAKVRQGMDGVSSIVARDFHTVISPCILSADEFRKRFKERSPLVRGMLDSYRLVYGSSLERIVS